MKKLLFASVVVAMAFAVNASAQISVGAGYVNETVITKEASILGEGYSGYSWSKDRMQLNGFYLEAMYNWNFAQAGPGDLALQAGLRYNCLTNFNENSKTNITYTEGESITSLKGFSKNRTSDHFIDIPVHLAYAYNVVPGSVRAYAFAGPVLSLGLAAQSTSSSKTNTIYDGDRNLTREIERYNAYTGNYYIKSFDNETNKYNIDRGRDDKYKLYNMFDLKLALGVGVTISEKVDIKLGYNIGLLNRSFIKNTNDTKYSVHSNVFYFGTAYNF